MNKFRFISKSYQDWYPWNNIILNQFTINNISIIYYSIDLLSQRTYTIKINFLNMQKYNIE